MSSTYPKSENNPEKILVLLVDDQAMVAEGVRRMLAADPSIDFHYVTDPSKAIEVAERICPTVIFQDLVMPGVNGLDLLRAYRDHPLLRSIPIIVLSSKEDPEIKQAAFESGANDYVVKLPHGIELLARVRSHSQAYVLNAQRQRAFQALESSQRELIDKNTELVSLNQKLEEATRFKSEFFANVSHEIRTPLIGVVGMAEILGDTDLNVHQRELVDVVRTNGETLLYMINDILDMSKIESGKLELELLPFVLRDVVDQAMDLLAPTAFGKGLQIYAWIDPQIATTVVGDITRVRQVLLNLINNSIKFTPFGEIELYIEPSIAPPNMVHFCVKDSGIGIPPEKLHRLFRSFSQVDASTNRRFGGTGLGLSICRNLAELMGGSIWVESTLGKGSEFHFVISLPSANIEKYRPEARQLRSKNLLALVRNTQLIRLLVAWAEELSFNLIVRSEYSENLDQHPPNYLIIDADYCQIQVPQSQLVKLILLTRSRNVSELATRYPEATVLSLPLKKRRFLQAVDAAEEVAECSLEMNKEAGTLFSALKILVVDDNTVSRRVCVAQLRKLGVREISEVENGREAINAAREHVFDIIFMDVQMPLICGLQATQAIRLLLSISKQPRIIGLTANAHNEERERCLGAGMDDQLIKPLRADQLSAVLQKYQKHQLTLQGPGISAPPERD